MSDVHCPACGERTVEPFLLRRSVPVHQNVLFADPDTARNIARGDLHMTVCTSCGFVFNAAFEASKIVYGVDYDNSQIHSPFFAEYVDGLVRRLVERDGGRARTIVEIGCGKGDFIRRLIEAEPGSRGFGFDTTYDGPGSAVDGRLTFRRAHYDEHTCDVDPDLVLCRHVIEHIHEPGTMLRSLRSTLNESRRPSVVFETPSVEWIFRGRVIWDLFYEHCSLFSETSLTSLFERCGYTVEALTHVFNDQYLWIEACPGASAERSRDVGALVEACRTYGRYEQDELESWRERVQALAGSGGVAIWGAGAKGVTLANLVDPAGATIDCLVDVNPKKQGRFVAGTGHPIVRHDELANRRVRSVILMNPNYETEVRAAIQEAGLGLSLVS